MKLDKILKRLEAGDPSFVWKRRLTITAFAIRMFLIGVEYGIILPSVWLYLKEFKVETWFLGLVVASYTGAAMVSLPIVGRIYDMTKRTKEIIMVMNLFEILGNLIYALPFSPWLPLIGRLVAGLGDGFFAAANGEVSCSYPAKMRTGTFALLELGRVLGITFGPFLNFFLQHVDFWIGRWHVNFATAPGVFMALVWVVMQFVTVLMVFNLSLEHIDQIDGYVPTDSGFQPPMEGKEIELEVEREAVTDKQPLLSGSKEKEEKNGPTPSDSDSESEDLVTETSVRDAVMELCNFEVLVIFYTDLVLWLTQTEFEVLAPLVTQEDFGWKETYLSLIYIIGGIILITLFLLIWYVGSNVDDAYYLLLSLSFSTIGLILMIAYEATRGDHTAGIIIFCLIAFLVFSSIPLNLVASKSLLTKITRSASQGFTQGVYSSVSRIALILGPILGSAAFHNLALFGALMAPLCVVAFIWLVLCLEKIRLRKIKIEEEAKESRNK